MENKIKNTRLGILVMMVFVAALSRLLPHPPNFTPIGAMALFGAAYFGKKWMALVIPFVAIWMSNLILDNIFLAQYYEGFVWFSHPFVYIAFALVVGFGWLTLKKVKPSNLVISSFAASVIFFLVSNFGHWVSFHPNKTWTGLLEVYAMGIPFFGWTILGDLFYVGVLFGAFEWMRRKDFGLSKDLA